MSQAPSMPLFCDAYLGDTKHLSLEEHGAYLLILMVTWRNNGRPLPDDPKRMARMLGVSSNRWATRIRPAIVGLFDVSDGTFRQKRLEKEWAFVSKRSNEMSKRGERGAAAKWAKTLEDDMLVPHDKQCLTDGPQAHTQSHIEESSNLDGRLGAPAAPAPMPEPIAEARPKPNGHDPPAAKPDPAAERERRRDLLISKLYRFIKATMTGDEAMAAGMGLMDDDKAEANRWLNKLDKQMRRKKWDDVRQ